MTHSVVKLFGAILAAAALLLPVTSSAAVERNPKAVTYKLPDQIKWSEPMPAGSFVTHFGKQVHYVGAKDTDAVILVVGDGPATATPFGVAPTAR